MGAPRRSSVCGLLFRHGGVGRVRPAGSKVPSRKSPQMRQNDLVALVVPAPILGEAALNFLLRQLRERAPSQGHQLLYFTPTLRLRHGLVSFDPVVAEHDPGSYQEGRTSGSTF